MEQEVVQTGEGEHVAPPANKKQPMEEAAPAEATNQKDATADTNTAPEMSSEATGPPQSDDDDDDDVCTFLFAYDVVPCQ